MTAFAHKAMIAGTGAYLPEKILTNKDLEQMVETDDAWITERTGIRERHIAAPEQASSDLALIASQRALEMAGLDPKAIDMIIFATASPDYVIPASGCQLQAKLGCGPCVAFDLSAACSGFVYALSVANQFIRTGLNKNVLVVGAEVLSRMVNYKDRETCILFGDGAGAAVISRAPEGSQSEIISEHLYADGELGDLLIQRAGGSRMRITHEVIDQGFQFMEMRGREVFKHAIRTMSRCAGDALKANHLTNEQIDWFIPHQANQRILEGVAKQMSIPMSKVIMNLERTGNTSAATVPMAMDEAIRDGRIKRGQLLLLAVFGAGITSGSILMRY